ncbi:MAG TPA: hypothetical protein VIY53_20700 [Acidobacteriaceae bacterium]
MRNINFRRWLLGGLVAGVVIDIIGFIVDGLWLKPAWQSGVMTSLGLSGFTPSTWAWFNVLGIIEGLLALWVYAAIRNRFGPGVNTAFKAAVVTWAIGSLLPNLSFMVYGGIFSKQVAAYTALGAFVELVIGTIAGAALYKEATVPVAAPAVPVQA